MYRPLHTLVSRSSNASALLVIGAATITAALLSFTTVNRLKDAVIAASLHERGLSIDYLLAALGFQDALIGIMAIVVLSFAIVLEIHKASISRLLHTASETETVVLLLLLLAWVGHSYLNPGVLLGGDTGTHISRFLEIARGLESGHLASWTNYQYAGAPLLWFTGPLTYIVGGLLAYILNDAVLAAKVFLFSFHMASGILLYAFLRRLAIKPLASMLIAVAFSGAFGHLHLFLYRGTFPQALTIFFLVMLFYSTDVLLRPSGARWPSFTAFALSTAGLIVNHQPHALFVAAYLVAFAILPLHSGFWDWRRLPLLVSAGVLGALASMVAVVPVLAESDWVMIEPEGSMFQFRLPTLARLLQLVVWRNTRTTWGIDYWAYLGIGLLVLTTTGVVACIRKQLPQEHRIVVLTSLSCLFIGFFMYNPVVRDIMFILFFCSIISAIGFDWLLDRPIIRDRRLLVFVAVIMADLASTAIQPVARTDKEFMADAGRWIEHSNPNQRVVQVATDSKGRFDADKGPDGGPISYYSTVQRIAGNHNMAATRLHNYLVSTAALVESDLRSTGNVSPRTMSLLRIYNVGEVICQSSISNGCPPNVQAPERNSVLGRYIPVEGTPVLFSRQLTKLRLAPSVEKPMLWPDDFAPTSDRRRRVEAVDNTLDHFLAVEQPDGAFASAIAVYDDPVGPEVVPPIDGPWAPQVVSYAVGLDHVELLLKTDMPCYAQLSYPWFPSMMVTINGMTVHPIRGATNLLVISIAPGVSTIELRDSSTPARTISILGSALGLAIILIVAAYLALSDRKAGTRAVPLINAN